jgi:hypothetical protein
MVGWLTNHARFRFLVAGLLLVAFALVYGRTACPTIFGGDSAELAAAAATFGVPHPPGYPLYTIVTGLLSRPVLLLGLAEDYGGATSILSGLYAAGALALLFLLARRLGCSSVGASVAALALGMGRTFWSQATVTEVYTFDVLLGLGAALAYVVARESGSSRASLVAAVLVGSWLGHRFVNVLYLPALLALAPPAQALAHAKQRWGVLLFGALGAGLVFLYLPLASLRDPAIDIGDPSTLERFLVVVKGTPYMRHMAGGGGQLGRFFMELPSQLGPAAIFALVGVFATWRGQRRVLFGAAYVATACLSFASRYRILDIDVYFVPALAALALIAGFGADLLVRGVGHYGRAAAGAAGSVALALAAYGLWANWARCDVSWNRLSLHAGQDLLASVDEDGLVLVQGDSTIHGLWYLQAVQGLRPDVLVLSLGHLWPWHMEQLRARFPDEPWPGEATDARALLDALSATRPTYAALSVDTSRLIAPGADGKGYGTVAAGAASRLLPAGSSMNARELALASHELLTAAVERLGPIPAEVDMDSKSTLLQYALSLTQNAALLDRLNETERAAASRRLLLTLDPDRHENDVVEDVWRGLGQRIPRHEMGRRARAALAE